MKRTNTAVWLEKHNRWQINVQKDGVRKSFTSSKIGRTGQRETNAKADAWLNLNTINYKARTSTIFDEFLVTVLKTTSTTNSLKIKSHNKNWIAPRIGHKKLIDVSEQDLQDILNDAYAKGLSKKSITNIRGTLSVFLKYCRKKGYTKLQTADIEVPKAARSQKKSILQPNDLKILFTSDNTFMYNKVCFEPLVNAFRFQLVTGLRPGELMGLEWGDIQGNILEVKRSINYLNEETSGKNENSLRRIVLSEFALNILNKQPNLEYTKKVFGDLNLSTYSKRWKRYCEYNNIQTVTLYELRHTFVSIIKNLSEGSIKLLVGHSKNIDTFGIYSHEIDGELNSIANSLDNIFTDLLSK